MTEPRIRNPRKEATALLPEGYEGRVLEPSPPANTDPDWFADEPTDPSGAGGELVTPIPGEGTTWKDFASEHPRLAVFANENWLDGDRRLTSLPDEYDMTRRSLHQIAFHVVAPARHAITGKLGLRFTLHGFGSPFFGEEEQIRVENGRLVYQTSDEVRSVEPGTLAEACEFSGIPYRESWFGGFHDPPSPIGSTTRLDIATDAATAIGEWFGFATLVLERTRRTPGAEDVSRVQLWPEHFDTAIEMGSSEKGHRASYGASPGDEMHAGPYLYVASWGEIDRGDRYWNDHSFNGASLSYEDILDTDDQVVVASDFYRRGYERLTKT